MTKEQYNKATKINNEIQKYEELIIKIKNGLSLKKAKDNIAKKNLDVRGDDRDARWQLSQFFGLRFINKKIIVMPHYEFAQGIEMDADPELIDIIIDYLEKKKETYEAEFKQIGG